jgi:diguanylate cyclase (GGDEF)-like protein
VDGVEIAAPSVDDALEDLGREARPVSVFRSRIVTGAEVATAVGLFVFIAAQGSGLGTPQALIALVLVEAFGIGFAYQVQPSDTLVIQQFDEAVFIVAVALLPAGGVVAVFGLGVALGLIVLRTPPRVVLMNSAMMAIAAVAGLATLQWAAPETSIWLFVALPVGAVTFAVVNEALLALYYCVTAGDSFSDGFSEMLRARVTRAPFLIVIGLLGAAAAAFTPAAALIAIPLLLGLQYVMAEHTRATRDSERAQGLFEASKTIHSSVVAPEVEAALMAATARLLRCSNVRLSTVEPGANEWGGSVDFSDGSQMWLIASEPTTEVALDAEARQLLDALAAIGASALDNARLVEEIRRAGLVDSLTGLPNHVLFDDRVAQAAASARRNRERFAVMVLDLDAFKKVNDSLGHSHGNDLLKIVADRLLGAARDIDTVARLGSDHFTLLLPGIGNPETAAVIAEKLLETVRRPIKLNGHDLFMTASAGIAFYPDDGTRSEHLLRNADSAMHRAKQQGRDTFCVYSSGMNDLAQLRLVRESELHNAIERGELRLRYQPQIDLRTSRIVGVEALVRWDHPVLGLLGPSEFVPLAEESGLIVEVDTWVLYEACRQAKAWLDAGLPATRVAVNISGRHFHSSERLIDVVDRALGTIGLPAHLLELEVTEGIAVGEEEATAWALSQIRNLGVQLAIDDFGTGYSMLGRLRTYPIDRLKIDRSFVKEIVSHNVDAPIVSAMIAMARSLHIECVAEGVETLEQQLFLRNHGCDHAQGFLYAHPLEPQEIVRMLQSPTLGFNLTQVS